MTKLVANCEVPGDNLPLLRSVHGLTSEAIKLSRRYAQVKVKGVVQPRCLHPAAIDHMTPPPFVYSANNGNGTGEENRD